MYIAWGLFLCVFVVGVLCVRVVCVWSPGLLASPYLLLYVLYSCLCDDLLLSLPLVYCCSLMVSLFGVGVLFSSRSVNVVLV